MWKCWYMLATNFGMKTKASEGIKDVAKVWTARRWTAPHRRRRAGISCRIKEAYFRCRRRSHNTAARHQVRLECHADSLNENFRATTKNKRQFKDVSQMALLHCFLKLYRCSAFRR